MGAIGTFFVTSAFAVVVDQRSALPISTGPTKGALAVGPTPTPSPTPAPAIPTPTAMPKVTTASVSASNQFGISTGDTLPWMTQAAMRAELDDFKSLGVGWVRLDFNWAGAQPNNAGEYDWSHFDAVVAEANARGLKLLPVLAYTPAWARMAGCNEAECAPADINQFAAFAGAAAKRYSGQGIRTWEIWNEPNSHLFWKPKPDAARYAQLLIASSKAIKAADSGATIVSAGLAPLYTENNDISQFDFLEAMYQSGAQSSFDAVGYHPYSWPVPSTYLVDWSGWSRMAQTPLSMLSIMTKHGDGAKKIWATEYGAPTGGPGGTASTNNYQLSLDPDHVDETLQAAIAMAAVKQLRSYNFAGPLFWYSYKDYGTSTSTNENFFGLLRADGTRKPAYAALQAAIANP